MLFQKVFWSIFLDDYVHEIIYARATNCQEKRKRLILIYVIMNYLILKVIRTEA